LSPSLLFLTREPGLWIRRIPVHVNPTLTATSTMLRRNGLIYLLVSA
jgi:hypothetical protein